jgi:RNA polymerase sigma-70 factor, ECF subfamily
MARGRPGDATESQQPGGAGTGKPLPAQREAVSEAPTAHGTLSAADRSAYSDAELLKRHVDGDPEAFGELFRRHQERLWAVAVRTLADPEDAADALQEAMISAFRRAASFRGDSAVTTWLHRIVVNACLDRMRRRAARPEITGGDERLLDVLAAGAAGGDPAPGSELSMEVMAALRQLPRDQQVALVLVDMLEYGVADAAELLGVAQGTVKSRCARGRARLLPRLGHLRDTVGAASGSVSAAPAQRFFTQPPADSEQQKRNQIPPGSVLPAQKGGEEEE